MRILIFGAEGALAGQLESVFRSDDVISLRHADCDITNADDVMRVVRNHRPTHLFNAAAYNDVDTAEADDATAIAVNATAVAHLASAAAAAGAVMIHYSTDYVFDGTVHHGYRESDVPHPINAYGRSKLLGEMAVQSVAREIEGFRWYCIRTSKLFGPTGSSKGAKKSFVDLMLARADAKAPIEVLDTDMSAPTYTVDLAEATRRCVDASWFPGIYHLTNSSACTRYGFAQEIFRQWQTLTGKTPPMLTPVTSLQRIAARPNFSILLNTKAPPLRSWQEALRAYLQDL